MQDRDILRPSDIAPQLGLTTSRVYQLIKKGVIPATRVGGSIRIPRAAWLEWLVQQRDRAVEDSAARRCADASGSNGADSANG